MKDVMLDLETFGNTNNAVITQIGACYFNRNTGEIGDTLSINVDAQTGLDAGFEVTGSTLYWWLNQSEEARQSICNTEGMVDIREAIGKTNQFLSKAKQIWSHATFDYVILLNHLHKLGYYPLFHYRTPRDIRTLTDLANLPIGKEERVGVHHNALSDCLHQVKYTVKCLKALKR